MIRFQNLKNKFSKNSRNRRVNVGILVLFALIGAIVLSQTRAATQSVSVEPETGVLSNCAQANSDASASGGAYVKFAATNSCLLDNSGKTIPDTNYTIPSGAIYMSPAGSDKTSNSPDGNDNNDGKSEAKPVKTINVAISKVPSGGTIVMRGGEYRDWNFGGNQQVTFQGKSFTLQAYPHESPWFNGSDIVNDGWSDAGGGLWQRTWDTPNFCGGQYYTPVNGKPPFSPNLSSGENTACAYWDAVKENPNVAGDPQMVFVNDKKLAQVPDKSKVNQDTFYYDWANKKIYISTNPAGKKLELVKRPQALMLNKGQHNFKGIGFKRFGSGAFPEGSYWYSANTVLVNEPQSITIENTVFADNAGHALAISKPNSGSRITKSIFANNGGNGINSNGNARSGSGRNDFTIENNVFNNNNQENFDTKCSASCGAADVKLANMVGFTSRNNIFENTVGRANGFWCDVNCTDGVIVNNLARNVGGRGLFYEISSKGIIASNVVINSGMHGISVYSASTKIYNNTVVIDNASRPLAQAYAVVDDDRWSNGSNASTGIGPDTRDIEFANNLAVSLSDGLLMISSNSKPPIQGTNTTVDQFYNVFDYNAYFRKAQSSHIYHWGNPANYDKSSSAFTARTGWDGNAIDLTGDISNLFVDYSGGDYRVRSDSPAFAAEGVGLPSDVASALGLPAGSKYSRGAISWPGKK